LLNAGGDFTKLMDEHASVKRDGNAAPEQGVASKGGEEGREEPAKKAEEAGQAKDGKRMEVEESAKGTVERSVFVYYIRQVGRGLVFLCFILYIIGSLVRVFRDWWLSRWATFDTSVVIAYDPDTWSDMEVTHYYIAFHVLSALLISAFTATSSYPDGSNPDNWPQRGP
jgi:hypothetical protein